MTNTQLKMLVYTAFSNTGMVLLSLLAMAGLLADHLSVTPNQTIYLIYFNWFMWAVFLVEFTLKLYLEDNKVKYLKAHRRDLVVTAVILLTPLVAAYLNAFYPASRPERVIRASPILSEIQISHSIRIAAYAVRAYMAWQYRNERKKYIKYMKYFGPV